MSTLRIPIDFSLGRYLYRSKFSFIQACRQTPVRFSPRRSTVPGTNAVQRGYASKNGNKPCLRLMPLGGSITHGVGSSDGNGYRNILLEMLQSNGMGVQMTGSRKSGSMTDNEHEGWRGFRIDQITNQAKRSVPQLKPDILAINAGSNDCLQDKELESFGQRVDSLLEYLWVTSPSATILLSTLLVNQDSIVDSRAQLVNDQIRSMVYRKQGQKKQIVLVDMRGAKAPQVADLVDGTHPGDSGYRKMANVWFHGIQEAIQKGFIGFS